MEQHRDAAKGDQWAHDPWSQYEERADIVRAVLAGLLEAARGDGYELEEADARMRRELGFPPPK